MARALNDILTELNSVYQPQKDLYNKQISEIDPAMQAEDKGLQAQQQDSFNQITQGANRRGLLFSGIPLQEQAQYTGSQYLPAVANLKAKYAQQRFNLQDALAKINQDQYQSAYGIYNNEVNQDNARRAAAAAAGAGSPSFGSGFGDSNGSVMGAQSYGKAVKKADGGFAFTGPNGQAVSAAQYAAMGNIPFRDLLSWMAGQGDQGAKAALGFSGNDYGYDPNKIGNAGSIYNSLVWGTGKTAPTAAGGGGGGGF